MIKLYATIAGVLLAVSLGAGWYVGSLREEIEALKEQSESLKTAIEIVRNSAVRNKTLYDECVTINNENAALHKEAIDLAERRREAIVSIEREMAEKVRQAYYESESAANGNECANTFVGNEYIGLLPAEARSDSGS